MDKNLDILSIGDASIDVFITPSESDVYCSIDTKECIVSFSYGDKIPVKTMQTTVGGNAANNAIGVKRLGLNTAIILTVGDDDIGERIAGEIRKEGVDTSYITTDKGVVSNYSTIINYASERTIFVYHAPRSYKLPVKMPNPKWAYLTSMGETFQPFYKQVIEWLNKNPDVKLAFNPGSYQFRAGTEVLKPALERTEMIFVNREEAEELTGTKDTQGQEKVLLRNLSNLGPKISVITDGAKGSYIFDGSSFVHAGVFPVDAYERTGAGDAFGAGCLSAIIKGKSLKESLVWGTLSSASVIGYVGPQRGLLNEAEMAEWVERYESAGVEAKEI